jgi:DNA-binding NarL/FixJ family response regulator
MASLADAIDRLRAMRAHWVAVSGEPGAGKTRLLNELCSLARGHGHLVLVGRGAELERDLPFGVWVDALDDHVASLGEDRLTTLVGERVAELTQVLPSATAGGASLGGLQDERFRAYRAVRALLQQLAARQPVVVVLDDVHWADDASLELLAHLLRRPTPARLLIALAFRTGQVPLALAAALEAAARDGTVTELALSPLSRREAESLLGEGLPEPVRDALYRRSGGNPFYLQELARAERRSSPHAIEDVDEGGVPSAIRASFGQELAALSESARRLASGAAVAGDPAELELAVAAAGLSEDTALEVMDELLAREILHRTSVPRRYGFRHPIVRRAVYDMAGEGWRLHAHARAAAALEGRPSALGARAHHIERCARGGDEAAAAVLQEAAHRAAARAPGVAARWLSAALRLLPDRPGEEGGMRRLGVLIPLAGTLASTGRLSEALDALQEALAIVPPRLADVRVRLIAACAACENLLGRHGGAHARLLAALDELPAEPDAARVALHVELAADALYDSDFAAMRDWAAAAAEAAGRLGESGLLAVAEGLLCFAHAEAADTARIRSGAALDVIPDEQLAARLDAPYYLGFAEFFCEHFEDSVRHLRRGIAVSRVAGQGQFVIYMMVGLAHALERLGRLHEALSTAEAAVEAARLAGYRQFVAFALVSEAWTAAALGDAEHARTAADEAVTLLDGLDESVLTHATHAHVGVMWLDLGEPDLCIEQLRAVGLPDLRQIEPGRRCWLFAVLARAELERGDRRAAGDWLERSEAIADTLQLPLAQAWTLHARALLSLADGDAAAAAEQALEGAKHADAVRAVVPAARCRTLAGVALARAGRRDDAIPVLTRAEAELAAAGASRHRDEAAHELRRLGRRISARQRRRSPGQGLEALSGRELEIAQRVALGRTNREIAGDLFLSEKTIEGHLTSVFAKLAVTSRSAVAEVVGRSRPDGD